MLGMPAGGKCGRQQYGMRPPMNPICANATTMADETRNLADRPAVLAVVVPTFNERDNIEEVVRRVGRVLEGLAWEIIFVDDDSPDGTAELAGRLGQLDARVRCIRRIGRRGLASACIEGICSTHCEYVAVMDADLQHDEGLLREMFERTRRDGLDLVIGSRFVGEGSYGEMPPLRQKMSRLATWLGTTLLRTRLSDPMSGFFLVRRETFMRHAGRMSGKGFKILLDYVTTADNQLKIAELPYHMRARQQGQSKLDTLVLWEYLLLICDKTIGRFLPVRFLFFGLSGLVGAVFHLAVLRVGLTALALPFLAAQGLAVYIAMTLNYFTNNRFTYADRRQRGIKLLGGLGKFYLACSPGAALNLTIAGYLYYGEGVTWWVAGLLGVMVAAGINYTLVSANTLDKNG